MASILHASPASITAASSSLCSKGQVWGGNAQRAGWRVGGGGLAGSQSQEYPRPSAHKPNHHFQQGGPDWLSLTPKAGLFSPSSLSHLFTHPRIHSKCAKQLESPYQAPWLC